MAAVASATVQQGDLSRVWTFNLTENRRPWAIPTGYEFVLRMTARGATEATIEDADCDYTPGNTYVTYSPSDGDTDTAGIFRAQLRGTDPDDSALVLEEFEITIVEAVPGAAAP